MITNPVAQLEVVNIKGDISATRGQQLYAILKALRIDMETFTLEILEAQKRSDAQVIIQTDTSSNEDSPETPSPLNSETQLSYCAYRPLTQGVLVPYRTFSTGRPCTCNIPHVRLRPQHWQISPAEAEWDYELPNGSHTERTPKVTFAEDPVSDVQGFERWYQDEYEFSDRYWSSGPVRVTSDWTTEIEDENNTVWLDSLELEEKMGLDLGGDEEVERNITVGEMEEMVRDFDFDGFDDDTIIVA